MEGMGWMLVAGSWKVEGGCQKEGRPPPLTLLRGLAFAQFTQSLRRFALEVWIGGGLGHQPQIVEGFGCALKFDQDQGAAIEQAQGTRFLLEGGVDVVQSGS